MMEQTPAGFVTSARTLGIFVGGLFAALLVRLYAVQVLSPRQDRQEALAQTQRPPERKGRTLSEKPLRAPILDRTGRILARSWFEHDLVIDPSEVVRGKEGDQASEAAVRTADLLSAVLDTAGARPRALDLRARILNSLRGGPGGGPRQWLQVSRGLSPRQRRLIHDGLERAPLRGFSFEDHLKRDYPYGSITAQVVGIVGEDEHDGRGRVRGRAGVEWQLDEVLEGEPGAFSGERDKEGREFLPEWCLAREIAPGSAVVLTIDAEIQRICMEALEAAARRTEAQSASAVVLEARTGEILAAATWPSVDPQEMEAGGAEHLKLGAFVDLYEPGSTIKPVFIGWALQQKVITMSSMFDCGGPKGFEYFGPRKVEEYIANPHPLTTQGVIIKSSNVGACRIAFERLGLPRMYDALEAFRIAGRPDIPYPIPAGCYYTPRAKAKCLWTGTSMPQGYEIMVSPLGLARIFLCYARQGEMIEPSLLREVRTPEGSLRPPSSSPGRRYQVIDRPVAARMLEALERVVEEGTGRSARSTRWSMAGKTGTPKITGTNLYNPVFCGIAPVRHREPEIVIVLQQHRVRGRGPGTYTGGAVSAPYARDIVERTLAYLGVPAEEGR